MSDPQPQPALETLKAELAQVKAQLDQTRAELEALRPRLPQKKAAVLDPRTCALLVLDMSTRLHDPKVAGNKIIPGLKEFLARARASGVFTVFTISAAARGTPQGLVYEALERREIEPVIFPDGYDKFTGGEIQQLLAGRGIKVVIVTGASTNIAVLYTATTAARHLAYQVIIPVDGMAAAGKYEQDYAIHQLANFPGDVSRLFTFTTLGQIAFGGQKGG